MNALITMICAYVFIAACIGVLILAIDYIIGHLISIYQYIVRNYAVYVSNLQPKTAQHDYHEYFDVYRNYKNWFPTQYLSPRFYLFKLFAFIHKRKHPEDYI